MQVIYWSVREASQAISVSRNKFYEYLNGDNPPPFHHKDGKRFFVRDELLSWLKGEKR